MSFLRSLVCTALLLALAPAAFAHARLVRSLPARDAQLNEPPARVELWFNELLDEEFNTIEVFPAEELTAKGRSNLAKGKPVVDRTDRTHLTANVGALSAGEYVVEWRVLSRDGHSAPGRLTFRVLAR